MEFSGNPGTFLAVYGVLVWNASTELTFTLDGVTLEEGFTHSANESSIVSYNVQLFASDTLSWDTHTFTVTNGHNSLLIFDYMGYRYVAQVCTLPHFNDSFMTPPYRTHASIDAVKSPDSEDKTKSTVIAVVVVIVILVFALGALFYYCRRRRYKGYGPPMDRILCKRPTGRGTNPRRSVDLVQEGWGEKGLRPQQSNPSMRAGLLKPEGVSRTQGTSSTIAGASSASDNTTAVELMKEKHPPVVDSALAAVAPLSSASQGFMVNGGSSPQVRHGHPTTFQLPPLKIPERHTQTVVAAPDSNTSSSKTPPPLPSKSSPSDGAQRENPPAGSRSTLPAMPKSSPPTSFPSPPSSLGSGSKKSKRPRPKSDPRSGIAGRPEHMRSLAKRRSVVNGAATPSTGSRTSGMIASDRTTASTPTSMVAPDGFIWDNASMPDLPARADSVKTVSTMALTGRHCDRLTGNVYVDTTPLPDNASFPLRSNTDKSSDTMSPGTAWTTNGSSISHTRSFSPPATLAELEPVPVVDRRPAVESPVSLPNSPNAPLLAAALQVVASAQTARMSAYSDSAVPIGPRLPIFHEVPMPATPPDRHVEDTKAEAEEALVIVSPPPEVHAEAAPSTPALLPSSPKSIPDTGSPKVKPPALSADSPRVHSSRDLADSPKVFLSQLPAGSPKMLPSQLVENPPEVAPPPPVAYSPRPESLTSAQDHFDTTHRRSITPLEAPLAPPGIDVVHEEHEAGPLQHSHPVLNITVQSDRPEPPSRNTRMEWGPRKLPPVPLPLATRLDTVIEDVVSPRFMRPLPRPQPQQEVNRTLSMSSTTGSRDSLDTAEVTVGERFNILSAVGHSLQVHSPQPSVPVLLTPSRDLFAQWHSHSDSSDTSSVSSRPVALTRENSMSSAGVHAAPNHAPDTNIPKLWSRPSLERTDPSPSSTPAQSTPPLRALPLVPNRAPDVVLGTMLRVDRGGSEGSSLSTPSSASQSSGDLPRGNLLSPNRHPAMPLMGPRALPSPSERGSATLALGRGKSTRRFGI